MEPLGPGDPRQLGAFRLHARLGAGGMGQVFLGHSPAGRAVAVKVIRSDLARESHFRTRFRREVAAAAAVSGAYTAPVMAAGPDDDPPWLATAFVAGPSLDDAVEVAGPLPAPSVWKLAAGLVEALQAVHACGLIHRDLKPSNVLLASDGPRVIDFGISHALEGTVMTSTGQLIGTPAFMSPEQAEGERAGPRSDVFSLGCVIAYAATGQPPFGDDGRHATILYRVVHGEPALDGMPDGLRRLAQSCLAKKPAARPGLADLVATIAATRPPDHVSVLETFWPAGVTTLIRSHQEQFAAQIRASSEGPSAGPAPLPGPAGLTGLAGPAGPAGCRAWPAGLTAGSGWRARPRRRPLRAPPARSPRRRPPAPRCRRPRRPPGLPRPGNLPRAWTLRDGATSRAPGPAAGEPAPPPGPGSGKEPDPRPAAARGAEVTNAASGPAAEPAPPPGPAPDAEPDPAPAAPLAAEAPDAAPGLAAAAPAPAGPRPEPAQAGPQADGPRADGPQAGGPAEPGADPGRAAALAGTPAQPGAVPPGPTEPMLAPPDGPAGARRRPRPAISRRLALTGLAAATVAGLAGGRELTRLGNDAPAGPADRARRRPAQPAGPARPAPPQAGTPAWVAAMSGPVTSLALVGGTLVTSAPSSARGTEATEARDASTGTVAWRAPGTGPYGLAPGVIYIGGSGSSLLAQASADGTLIWGTPVGTGPIAGITATSRAVYVSAGNGVLNALDAAHGHQLWIASVGPARIVADTRAVYAVTSAGVVSAHRVSDGAPLWQAGGEEGGGRAGSGRGPGRGGGDGDADDGAAGGPFAIAVAGAAVYVAAGTSVSARQAVDGALIWSFTAGSPVTSGIAVDGRAVYAGTGGGRVLALAAGSGALIWRFSAAGPVASGIAADGGGVYFGTDSRTIESVSAAAGTRRWRFTADAAVQSQVTVGGGLVYAGSNGSTVYALHA